MLTLLIVMIGTPGLNTRSHLTERNNAATTSRESSIGLRGSGDFVVDLQKISVNDNLFMSLVRKIDQLPRVYQTVSVERAGIDRRYKIRPAKSGHNFKTVMESYSPKPIALTEKDVKAIFCLYLYTYGELQSASMVDFQPSTDRILVEDGRLRFENPITSVSFIDTTCKVMARNQDPSKSVRNS